MPPSLVVWQPAYRRARRGSVKIALLTTFASRSGPVARPEEVGVELFLGRAGRGLPVVAPGGVRRHRHQDRLGAAARLQAEERRGVVHKVDLAVAPAGVELEASLPFADRRPFPSLHDRKIGGQKGVAHRAHEPERKIEVALGEVVEEDAADAARLVAMLQVKVAGAPGLEARIAVGPERLERLPAAAREVARGPPHTRVA